MVIWLELGIFVLVIVFALWQIWDVRQAQAKTRQQKQEQELAHEEARPAQRPERLDQSTAKHK